MIYDFLRMCKNKTLRSLALSEIGIFTICIEPQDKYLFALLMSILYLDVIEKHEITLILTEPCSLVNKCRKCHGRRLDTFALLCIFSLTYLFIYLFLHECPYQCVILCLNHHHSHYNILFRLATQSFFVVFTKYHASFLFFFFYLAIRSIFILFSKEKPNSFIIKLYQNCICYSSNLALFVNPSSGKDCVTELGTR